VLEASVRETSFPLSIDSGDSIKSLGVQCHPGPDKFSFTVVPPEKHMTYTKRIILSEIARVFDPLGWLSPVTVRANSLLQKIWKMELGWDEGLLMDISQILEDYCQELLLLADIKTNLIITPKATRYELIGFCDASEAAYSAVVYLRSVFADGAADVRIVIGKTKVTPLKMISLPRPELCGALVLAGLTKLVQSSLSMDTQEISAWSDSTVVLAWLTASPYKWITFVANRVAEVQEVIPRSRWYHVNGEDNPADSVSRDISSYSLANHILWWAGPKWLRNGSLPLLEDLDSNSEDVTREQKTSSTLMCRWASHC
jgi:hypothetical protein